VSLERRILQPGVVNVQLRHIGHSLLLNGQLDNWEAHGLLLPITRETQP